MSTIAQRWRLIAGLAVLAMLALFAGLLLPPYIENWKLQQYLNGLSADPAVAKATPEVIRVNVVNKAAELGLPVHSDDVRVTREGDSFRVEVLYLVHVDLSVYSVELHFRPAA